MKKVDIEARITEAFGFVSRTEIAAKMDVKYQTLSNWLNGRTDFPSAELAKIANLTNYSLNWILTGEGPKKVGEVEDKGPGIFNEELLREFVLKIVREQMAFSPAGEIQDLGTIDEFLANEIKKHDNPLPVLEAWYRREGWPTAELSVPQFSGWNKLTIEQKVSELKAFREIDIRHRERHEILSPNSPKTAS